MKFVAGSLGKIIYLYDILLWEIYLVKLVCVCVCIYI